MALDWDRPRLKEAEFEIMATSELLLDMVMDHVAKNRDILLGQDQWPNGRYVITTVSVHWGPGKPYADSWSAIEHLKSTWDKAKGKVQEEVR